MAQTPPNISRYAMAGVEFIGTFGAMLALGIYLDQRMHTNFPGFTLGGALLGFAAALYRLIREARGLMKKPPDEKNRSREGG